MSTKDLMAKAVQAASSAKVLLDAGDTDGTCNRAYYRASLGMAAEIAGFSHRDIPSAGSDFVSILPPNYRDIKSATQHRFLSECESVEQNLELASPFDGFQLTVIR